MNVRINSNWYYFACVTHAYLFSLIFFLRTACSLNNGMIRNGGTAVFRGIIYTHHYSEITILIPKMCVWLLNETRSPNYI